MLNLKDFGKCVRNRRGRGTGLADPHAGHGQGPSFTPWGRESAIASTLVLIYFPGLMPHCAAARHEVSSFQSDRPQLCACRL